LTDDSRMQAADDGQYSCSCCASSCADKWTTVEEDDGDNKAKSPSAESRASVDSTANWYQQQIVTRHGKHAAATGDLDHHSPAMTPSQQQDLQPADTGFNCHSTAVGLSVHHELQNYDRINSRFLVAIVVRGELGNDRTRVLCRPT